MDNTSTYRAEIDGLRAVAVLSVLFYHVGFSAFSGGFVGVDVFLVISGFLITKIILDEVNRKGSFDFISFYIRRARRLLPAFLFVLLLSVIAASLILSPMHMERFAVSGLYAIFSVSNFFFWTESGYFDVSAYVKPLLHTWSLGIEWQYYLLWPAVFVFLLVRFPGWVSPTVLLLTGTASLYLNQIFVTGTPRAVAEFWPDYAHLFADGGATIFYLLPFRIYEFAIGAIMVWLIGFKILNNLALEAISFLGLSLIFLLSSHMIMQLCIPALMHYYLALELRSLFIPAELNFVVSF